MLLGSLYAVLRPSISFGRGRLGVKRMSAVIFSFEYYTFVFRSGILDTIICDSNVVHT